MLGPVSSTEILLNNWRLSIISMRRRRGTIAECRARWRAASEALVDDERAGQRESVSCHISPTLSELIG